MRVEARVPPMGEHLRARIETDARALGYVGASRIEKNETRRERNEEPSINFPDYIVPTCGGTLEILVACARSRFFSLPRSALKLFNCAARYFPLQYRLSRFLCACQRSNRLSRLVLWVCNRDE